MGVKMVGRGSGWTAAPEEYTRNKGTCGRKRICFVGASYKFVHKVLRDMLLVGGFEDCELVVHDIDEMPMNLVADLLEKIARQQKTRIKVSRTLDRREALKGADAVVLSITIGGDESDARSAEAAFKYGIFTGIGDTLGPAAFARNLRTVPFVVQLIKEMEELCPNAAMLNFTNPMSALTGAMARYSELPVYGLCHSADELFRYFASVFRCKKADVTMEIGGVNHQAFVTKLWIKGEDRTKDIQEATQASDAMLEDGLNAHRETVRLQQDVYKILGAWPSTGEDHLAEFYPFWFTERRAGQFGFHLRHPVKPGRPPHGRRKCPEIIHYWTYGPEPVGDLHLLTTEHAHELLWAHFTGEPYTRVLNVLNKGEFIRNIPKDACVEVLATVKGSRISADPIELPTAVHAHVQRWCAIHDLNIRAALTCDRQLAKQALMLDPFMKDFYDIDPLLEEFLTCLEPWLPRGWFAQGASTPGIGEGNGNVKHAKRTARKKLASV